jgi:hypothetical protein
VAPTETIAVIDAFSDGRLLAPPANHMMERSMINRRSAIVACVCGLALAAAAPAIAQDDNRERNLLAYVELLRADVRAEKVSILTEVMAFTEAEGKAFWPIYRQYDVDLSAITDQRIAMIAEYARNYDALSDATADKLIQKAIDLEARRNTLTRTLYENLKKAMSPTTAARAIQVEHQLLLVIDLQIAASLPIVK